MLRLAENAMTIKINAKVCSLCGLPVGVEYSEFIKTNKQTNKKLPAASGNELKRDWSLPAWNNEKKKPNKPKQSSQVLSLKSHPLILILSFILY